MSDSITKYYELMEKETSEVSSEHQRSVLSIVEILMASKKARLRGELLKQVLKISKDAPSMNAVTVFQLAADIIKLDQLCNKI